MVLSEPSDDSTDTQDIQIDVELGSATIFTTYDENSRTFTISEGATDESMIDQSYSVKVTLTDKDGATDKQTFDIKFESL